MKYFISALTNYAQFTGRARRSEYWYFALFYFIFYVMIMAVGLALSFPLLVSIFALGMLIPNLAVSVRRMHDVNKSGWFILIPIYNLILFCTDGTSGDNEYGPDPKGRGGFGSDDYEKPFDINPDVNPA